MRIAPILMLASSLLAQNGTDELDHALRQARGQELVSATKAMEGANRAVALAEQADDDTQRSLAFTALGRQQLFTARFAEASQSLSQASTLAEATQDKYATGMARLANANRLVRIGYFLEASTELLGVQGQLGSLDPWAATEERLLQAQLLSHAGQTPQAIEALLDLIATAKKRAFPRLQVRGLITLGTIAARQGLGSPGFSAASEYADRAQELVSAHNLAGLQSPVHRLRGYVCMLANQSTETLRLCQLSRKAAGTFGDRMGVARILQTHGSMLTYSNEFDAARATLQESLAIARELEAPLMVAVASTSLAMTYIRPSDLGRETFDASRAEQVRELLAPLEVDVLRRIGSPRLSVYWQTSLSKALARLGDHERAQELSWAAADTYRWFSRSEATADLALHRIATEREAELDRIANERAVAARQQQHDKQTRNLSLGAAGIFLTMAGVLFALFLKLRKTHAQVAAQGRSLLVVNTELKTALSQVKRLTGLIPMCARCKSVRDDAGYWQEIEAYITDHSEASCSHGICPPCAEELYPSINRPIQPTSPIGDA